MAFELAATTATSTAAVSAAGSSRAGLSHEDFLQEWNWCWIAQGKKQNNKNHHPFFIIVKLPTTFPFLNKEKFLFNVFIILYKLARGGHLRYGHLPLTESLYFFPILVGGHYC